MSRREVNASLDRAAALYQNGEILGALNEWEHALAMDPQCAPALLAIKALQDNYDLIEEKLLPAGKPLQLADLHYRTYSSPATTLELPGQGDEFGQQPTAELPGIDSLAAMTATTEPGLPLQATAPGLPLHATEPDLSLQATEPGVSLHDYHSRGGLPGIQEFQEPHDDQERTAERPGLGALLDIRGAQQPSSFQYDETLAHGQWGDALSLGAAGNQAPVQEDSFSTRATEELDGFAALPSPDQTLSKQTLSDQTLSDRPRMPGLSPATHVPASPDDHSHSIDLGDFRNVDSDRLTGVRRTLGYDERPGEIAPEELESHTALPTLDRIERIVRDTIESRAPKSETGSERTRRRVKGLIENAKLAHASNNIVQAVIALELAFAEDPDSAVSHKLLNLHRGSIVRIYREYLGRMDVAPGTGVALSQLKYEHIDARAAFLLSRVDGTLTLEELVDVAGMPELEALRYLSSLILRGILILPR